MNRVHRNSPDPLNAYNPWVVAVDYGHGQPATSRAKRSGTRSGAGVFARILRRVRAVVQRGAA